MDAAAWGSDEEDELDSEDEHFERRDRKRSGKGVRGGLDLQGSSTDIDGDYGMGKGREAAAERATGIGLLWPSLYLASFEVSRKRWFEPYVALIVMLNCFLTFLEPPSFRQFHTYPYWLLQVVRSMEVMCLIVYYVYIIVTVIAKSEGRFSLGRPRHLYQHLQRPIVIFIFITVLITVDVVTAMVFNLPVRWSRMLRPFLLVCLLPQLRRVLTTILHMLPDLVYIVAMLVILLIVYGVVGQGLFGEIYENGDTRYTFPPENFNDFATSVTALFVLLTTENYPNIMYPALESSYWYTLFFISFMIIGVFLLMAVLLAVMLDVYMVRQQLPLTIHSLCHLSTSSLLKLSRSHSFPPFKSLFRVLSSCSPLSPPLNIHSRWLSCSIVRPKKQERVSSDQWPQEKYRSQVIEKRLQERTLLIDAFGLLDTGNNGHVRFLEWLDLMRELRPQLSKEKAQLLFESLDRNNSRELSLFEFFGVVDVMYIEFAPYVPPTERGRLRRFVEHPYVLHPHYRARDISFWLSCSVSSFFPCGLVPLYRATHTLLLSQSLSSSLKHVATFWHSHSLPLHTPCQAIQHGPLLPSLPLTSWQGIQYCGVHRNHLKYAGVLPLPCAHELSRASDVLLDRLCVRVSLCGGVDPQNVRLRPQEVLQEQMERFRLRHHHRLGGSHCH